MFPKTVMRNPWVRAGAIVGALVLLLFLVWFLRPVLIPLFFAFLVAYVLDPVADFFERRGISRSKTIGAMAMVALLLLLSIPFVVVPSIFSQAQSLMDKREARRAEASATTEKGVVRQWGDSLLEKVPLWHLLEIIPDTDVLEGASEAPETDVVLEEPAAAPTVEVNAPESDATPLEEAIIGEPEVVADPERDYAAMPPDEVRAELAERIGAYVKLNARNILQSYAPTMAVAGQRAGVTVAHLVSSLGQWTLGAVVFIANLALFSFVAGFLLKDFDNLLRATRGLIPPRYLPKVEEIVGKIHLQITSFLRGQLTVCMCLGAMYVVGLTAARVPFSIPIGIFGGLAAFIPYIGILLTIIPSVILTLVAHGFDWHIAAVLATFAFAQFLEGTFLTPKIVGDKVGLNPVWVILAILVFGNAFGFLGILLAVPMAASLKVLVLEGIAYYRASKVFSESGDSGGAS